MLAIPTRPPTNVGAVIMPVGAKIPAELIVTPPPTVRFELIITPPPTVRFDIDVIPSVAIPVLFKLVLVNEVIIPEDAVIIPVILILCGNLELFKVPLVMLVALIPCIFVPNPLNEYAATTPVVALIPARVVI